MPCREHDQVNVRNIAWVTHGMWCPINCGTKPKFCARMTKWFHDQKWGCEWFIVLERHQCKGVLQKVRKTIFGFRREMRAHFEASLLEFKI
jgi:hypothetical protein